MAYLETEDLQRAKVFSGADLAANRLGKIAGGQIPRLVEQIVRPLVRSFLAVTGWSWLFLTAAWAISSGLHLDAHLRAPTGIAFFERFVLFRGLYIATFVRMFAVFMVLSCAGSLIIAMITTAVKSFDLICDALAGEAATIEGRVYTAEEECRGSALREQWTRVRQERRKTYRYVIGDIALDVSYEGFRALPSGDHYKLYYTPRSKLLLAIEPGGASRR